MMPKRVARFFKFFIHLRMLTQGAAGFDELFVRLGMLAQGAAGVPLNREFLRFLLVRRVLALGCGSCDTTDVSSWDSGVDWGRADSSESSSRGTRSDELENP